MTFREVLEVKLPVKQNGVVLWRHKYEETLASLTEKKKSNGIVCIVRFPYEEWLNNEIMKELRLL